MMKIDEDEDDEDCFVFGCSRVVGLAQDVAVWDEYVSSQRRTIVGKLMV